MSTTKRLTIFAAAVALEEAYANGVLPTAAQGYLLSELPTATIAHAYDGAVAAPAGTAGTARRAPAKGRSVDVPLKAELRPGAGAFSDAVLPAEHALMRASGHKATISNGAVIYAPTSDPLAQGSAALTLWGRGEKLTAVGALADLSITADGLGPVTIETPVQGIMRHDIEDAPVPPAMIYAGGELAPLVGAGAKFKIDGMELPVVRFAFKLGLGREQRVTQSMLPGDTHVGYIATRRTPTIEVSVEAGALGTFNPYAMRDAATVLAAQYEIPGAAGARWVINAMNAQIADVKQGAAGPVATWDLTIALNPSAPTADDDYTITRS